MTEALTFAVKACNRKSMEKAGYFKIPVVY